MEDRAAMDQIKLIRSCPATLVIKLEMFNDAIVRDRQFQ